MTQDAKNLQETQIKELIDAFSDLPILARLEFVANILLQREGDLEEDDAPIDTNIAVAQRVLWGAIHILRTVPQVDDLRGPL